MTKAQNAPMPALMTGRTANLFPPAEAFSANGFNISNIARINKAASSDMSQ
jgi:hypothetical protein